MAEFRSPPVIDNSSGDAPADNSILQVDAATDTWVPVLAASVGVLVVPQAAPSEVTQTSDAVVLADATNPANVGYVQADQTALAALANDLKIEVNALVVDVAAVIAELDALQTKLTTAGVLD